MNLLNFWCFYNELESAIKNVKSRDNLVIICNFNTKIGNAGLESNIYRKQVGIYGKRRVNSNGYSLLELANHSNLNLQILLSNTKNVIDQNRNRQSESVKLKTYREYHRLEIRLFKYTSKIIQMLLIRLKIIRSNAYKIRS